MKIIESQEPPAPTRGKRYLLNSAVVTAFGRWEYRPMTVDQAKSWYGWQCECGHEHGGNCAACPCSQADFSWAGLPQSTIGYAETAEAFAQLLQLPWTVDVDGRYPRDIAAPDVHRIQVVMQAGDEALVFRLVLPPGSPRIDPADKGQIARHLDAQHWELGLLTRLS